MYTKMQNQNENTTSQISPSAKVVFPSAAEMEEAWNKIIRERNKLPFSELPTDVVYWMHNMQSLTTKDGRTAYYAEFTTEDNYYIAWVPESLLKKFQKLGVEECWMINEGKKTSNNNNTYWDTKLLKME